MLLLLLLSLVLLGFLLLPGGRSRVQEPEQEQEVCLKEQGGLNISSHQLVARGGGALAACQYSCHGVARLKFAWFVLYH